MSYSVSNHILKFSSDFQELIILDSAEIEVDSFPLDPPIEVKVESNDYHISTNPFQGGFTRQFNNDDRSSLEFSLSQLGGITDIRLEDMARTHTYFLDQCSVVISSTSTSVILNSPCDSPCNEPLAICCTTTP